MSTSVRVLVGGEDVPHRIGVRVALEEEDFICEEADNAAEVLDVARATRPQICLLTSGMAQDTSLIGALAAVPGVHVVVLASSEDEERLPDILLAGGEGYLLPETTPAQLCHALRSVADGRAAIVPRRLGPALLGAVSRPRQRERTVRLDGGRQVTLTGREYDVLELLARGASSAEVAARLGISAVTVRRHASSATRKLGAGDRSAAVELLAGAR